MRFAFIISGNLLVFLSAFGFGGFLRPLLPRSFSKVDRLAVIPLGGFGLQGLLLYLVGLVRFTPAVIFSLLIPGALLGIRCLLQEARAGGLSLVVAKMPAVAGIVIALVLGVTALAGFAEPVGDERYDALYYHYLGPKVWLRDGIVHPVLDESHTAFPATVEIQFAPLQFFGGDAAPEFFSVIAFVLMIPVILATAIRCGLDPPDAWWAAALISAMPAVYRGLYGGMIDVIYAGFLILAARCAFDAESLTDYLLAGLFCGFAIGTKYTGLIATALLVLSVVAFPRNSLPRLSKPMLKGLALLCAAAGLVAAPWYLRNWLVLGCPIYPPPPFLGTILPARYFPMAALQEFNDVMWRTSWHGMGGGFLNLLLLPLHLTFHPANFESGAGGIGLLPLAFLPFCFSARRWEQFAKAFGFFGLLLTLGWFYTYQESRFLIQVYLIAAIFGVAGWRYVRDAGPRLARVLSVMTVAVSILYGLFMIVTSRAAEVRASVSASFAKSRNQAEIPFHESFQYLNRDPSAGKVLVLDPLVPTFYLDKDYIKPLGRRGEQPLPGITRPVEALNDLPAMHITHVLDVQSKSGGFQVPEHPKNLILIFETKGQRIYRVLPAPAPLPSHP